MNDNRTRCVLLAGATGLVGREILRLLVEDPGVAQVRILVRRRIEEGELSAKVDEHVVDFEKLRDNPELFHVDQVFSALGTTIRQAGSQEAFRRVDFDYPLLIARLALEEGARHILLVSALGADPASRLFYNRVKGELEEKICALGFPSVTIARPSLLLGDRAERRAGEEIARKFGWLIPSRWRPVPASHVAGALVRSAAGETAGIRFLENSELRSAYNLSRT